MHSTEVALLLLFSDAQGSIHGIPKNYFDVAEISRWRWG